MLGYAIIELFSAVLRHMWRKEERSRVRAAAPSDVAVRVFRERLAAWIQARGLVSTATPDTYQGVVDGVRVRVQSGLAGSRPAALEVTMDLAHGAELPELVTHDALPKSVVARALSGLFARDDVGNTLRSIAIVPNGLRARFAALAEPELVDVVVEECAAAVRGLRRGDAPYRS